MYRARDTQLDRLTCLSRERPRSEVLDMFWRIVLG